LQANIANIARGHLSNLTLNGEPSIFLLPIFFATQIIGGAKELVVLL
jgi:hypothetical protein